MHGATKDGTTRYSAKFPSAAKGHFRDAHRMIMSSLGMGSYLGQPDAKTDESYTASAIAAAESGINVFDAAINYRFQRSERNLGAALKDLAAKGYARDEFVLCTKGGYLTPDGAMPGDPNDYFFREYIQPGVFTAKDIVAGSHCMTPKFLKNQIGRSLKNLGVACIDIYYLHNPESQLSEISKDIFLERVREAFTFLESAVEAGEISYYGMATWNGFRQEAGARAAMQLAEIAQIAQEIAGGRHHFRFVQLPFNLGMTEALTLGNQSATRAYHRHARAHGDGSRQRPGYFADRQRVAAARPGSQELAGLRRRSARPLQRRGARPAVRALFARNNHRAGRHVQSSTRAIQRETSEHPASHRRTIHKSIHPRRICVIWSAAA